MLLKPASKQTPACHINQVQPDMVSLVLQDRPLGKKPQSIPARPGSGIASISHHSSPSAHHPPENQIQQSLDIARWAHRPHIWFTRPAPTIMYPYPEHFIVRPGPTGIGEAVVPLIAVDQLPDWMQLVGVPREIDLEQAVGLANLGLVACDGKSSYEVRLHTDKIRAILSVGVDDANEESVVPSDSVSASGKDIKDSQAQSASSSPLKQGDRTEAEKLDPSPPGIPQEQLDLLTDTPKKVAKPVNSNEAHSTPTIPRTRAWADDVSDVDSPDLFSAGLETPATAQEKEQEAKGTDEQPEPATEPGLSASRHNIANDSTDAKPIRKDQDIRPHLTEETRDARLRRPMIPRTKDRVFGMNPDTIYCRHWCHHGTCKWGWECRYQHRMPSNQDGLREVGLKDFPTWYLLMMAGGGLPGNPSIGSGMGAGMGAGMGLNHNMGFHSLPMSMDMSAMNLAMPSHHSNLLSGFGRSHHPADAFLNAASHPQYAAQHSSDAFLNAASRPQYPPQQSSPSTMELRLMQGRMSALLAGSTAMSNRQKLRQIKEMRELFLRSSNAFSQPHGPLSSEHGYSSLIGMGKPQGLYQGRSNLHTNASLAANAAGLSAASRRQALREAERGSNAPVEIPAGDEGEKEGGLMDEKGGSLDGLDGRLTPLGSDSGVEGAERDTAVREGNLVDIE